MKNLYSSRIYFFLAIILMLLLHQFCAFDFMYQEQNNFFLFTKEYAISYLNHPGGTVEYLANFIRQFYYYSWVGPIIVSFYFFLTCTGIHYLSKRFFPSLSIIAGLLLVFVETQEEYQSECSLALITILWTLTAVKGVVCRFNRVVAGLSFICSLFFLYYLLGFGYGEHVDISHSWTLTRYSNTFKEASIESYYPWFVTLLSILFSYLPYFDKREHCLENNSKTKHLYYLPQILLAFLLCGVYTYQIKDENTTTLKRLEVLRWHGLWANLIAEPLPTWDYPVFVCYKTLAMAKRGELSTYLMEYPHSGSNHLWIPYNGARYEADLLSDIYMVQGNVAMAQEMAFNAMGYYKHNINARLLVRLIETNIVYGANQVALKYIHQLENTWVYAEKARYYRACIENPEILAKDSYLMNLRNCLTQEESLTEDDLEDMKLIMKLNTQYTGTRDYYGSFLLLCHMKDGFLKFLNEFCIKEKADGTPVLVECYRSGLPKVFQQAVVLFLPESDWTRYGISLEIIHDYQSFKSAVQSLGGDLTKLPRSMLKTYWFYSLKYAQSL